MDRILSVGCLALLSCARVEPADSRSKHPAPPGQQTNNLCDTCFGDREVTPVYTRLEAQIRLLASFSLAKDLCQGKVWPRHVAAVAPETKQRLKTAACEHMQGAHAAKELVQPLSARETQRSQKDEMARLDAQLLRSAEAARLFCQEFEQASSPEADQEGVKRVKGVAGCQSLILESVRVWVKKTGSGA